MSAELFQSIFYIIACFCFIFISITYTKMLMLFKSENSMFKCLVMLPLDEEDFNCLVRGGVLNVCYMHNGRGQLIRIALKDIGFDRMNIALDKAAAGKEIYQAHNKIIE